MARPRIWYFYSLCTWFTFLPAMIFSSSKKGITWNRRTPSPDRSAKCCRWLTPLGENSLFVHPCGRLMILECMIRILYFYAHVYHHNVFKVDNPFCNPGKCQLFRKIYLIEESSTFLGPHHRPFSSRPRSWLRAWISDTDERKGSFEISDFSM